MHSTWHKQLVIGWSEVVHFHSCQSLLQLFLQSRIIGCSTHLHGLPTSMYARSEPFHFLGVSKFCCHWPEAHAFDLPSHYSIMSLNVKFEFSFDFLLFLKIVVATLQFKLWLEFVLTQFIWSSSTPRHSHTKYPLSYAKLKPHFLGVIKFVVGTFQALSGNRSNSSRSSCKQCHLQFKLRLLICASLLERGQILNRFWCYHVSCSWRESPPSFIRSSPTQCHLHRNY